MPGWRTGTPVREEVETGSRVEQPATRYRTMPGWYRVRISAPATEERGVLIPETARREPTEGTVIGCGPDWERPDGDYDIPELILGERVFFRGCHLRHVSREEGYLRFQDAVGGVYRSEKTGEDILFPCTDWFLIRPDAVSKVDEVTRARVVEHASGILQARAGTMGQEGRLKRRGVELYEELGRLGQSERYLNEPSEYYRHRVVWDFLEALTADEYRALGEAIEEQGSGNWQRYFVRGQRALPVSGVVLGEPWMQRNSRGCLRHRSTRVLRGKRVWFSRNYFAVEACDQEGPVLFIQDQHLEAVEEP